MILGFLGNKRFPAREGDVSQSVGDERQSHDISSQHRDTIFSHAKLNARKLFSHAVELLERIS